MLLAVDTAQGILNLCLDAPDRGFFSSLSIDPSQGKESPEGLSEHLFPAIDQLLKQAGVDISALTVLAVTTGPGGYSSIRIGVSAIRGMGLALSLPVYGIDCFSIWAAQVPCPSSAETLTMKPILDVALGGNRDRGWWQRFSWSAEGWVAAFSGRSISWQEWSELRKTETVFSICVGDAPISESPRPARIGMDAMIRLARHKISQGPPQERPAPLYCKEPDALKAARSLPVLVGEDLPC